LDPARHTVIYLPTLTVEVRGIYHQIVLALGPTVAGAPSHPGPAGRPGDLRAGFDGSILVLNVLQDKGFVAVRENH
jgi:hypothetical protein